MFRELRVDLNRKHWLIMFRIDSDNRLVNASRVLSKFYREVNRFLRYFPSMLSLVILPLDSLSLFLP